MSFATYRSRRHYVVAESKPSDVTAPLRFETVKLSNRNLAGKASSVGGVTKTVRIRNLGVDRDVAPTLAPIEVVTGSWWDSLPARYKVLAGCWFSFIICNMDKVNMSVAIIPMAQDFGWTPSVAGIVQSAFFWGYMLSQLPGGSYVLKLGGRNVLPFGVGLWSLSTAAVPLLGATVPGLCISRAAVGLGEAVAPSAAIDMVARTIPQNERSRAVSFIFSGLHLGSILGLLGAPFIISKWGWPTVFVCFGGLGVVWCLWFERLMRELNSKSPEVYQLLSNTPEQAEENSAPIPWRAFLRSQGVQAIIYTHFVNNWFHYTFMAWLPTYFTQTMSVDLMHAASTALLPPLAAIGATSVAGFSADYLISNGVSVPVVRKLAQSVAFVAPTVCLTVACLSDDPTLTVAMITAGLGISSFSVAGLYCTHQDLSPKYASTLLGLTNTIGALPGVLGVATIGFLYDWTQNWGLSLFAPSAVLLLTGAIAYVVYGKHEFEDFDAAPDEPTAVERWFAATSKSIKQFHKKLLGAQD